MWSLNAKLSLWFLGAERILQLLLEKRLETLALMMWKSIVNPWDPLANWTDLSKQNTEAFALCTNIDREALRHVSSPAHPFGRKVTLAGSTLAALQRVLPLYKGGVARAWHSPSTTVPSAFKNKVCCDGSLQLCTTRVSMDWKHLKGLLAIKYCLSEIQRRKVSEHVTVFHTCRMKFHLVTKQANPAPSGVIDKMGAILKDSLWILDTCPFTAIGHKCLFGSEYSWEHEQSYSASQKLDTCPCGCQSMLGWI